MVDKRIVGAIFSALALAISGLAHASHITGETGGIAILGRTLPTGAITGNWLLDSKSGLTEVAFDEAQRYTLTSALSVDAGAGTIPAGTVVDSVLVFFNDKRRTVNLSSLTFDEPVLGVEYKEDKKGFSPSLAGSSFLGRPGETYALDCRLCGFEAVSHDSVAISGERVSFDHVDQQPGDYARIILAAGVPEPANWALMLIGFGALGATVRARQAQGRARSFI